MNKLIDSHCHLNYDYSPKTLDEIVDEAHKADIENLITIGTEIPSLEEIQKISEKYPQVFHTVGVHPHDVQTLNEDSIRRLETFAQHPKCRAIGEIGLDYHYEHSPRDLQQLWLQRQLEIALRLRLPVVIHSREGEEDLLVALQAYASRIPTGNIPGIIHCFSGTQEFGAKCIELGFYISFSGILTFKNAEEVRSAARAYPLERLLVETDAPYLAPIPYRGKKCEPAMVKLTAQKLAELKNLSFEEVARVTTTNAKNIFKI